MKKVIIAIAVVLIYIACFWKDIADGFKVFVCEKSKVKIDRNFLSSLKWTHLTLDEVKKLKIKLKEMNNKMYIIKTGEEEILNQLHFSTKFSQLLSQQIEIADESKNVLKTLTYQTKYTDQLIEKTTDISLKTEKEILKQKNLSYDMVKDLNALLEKTLSLNNITDGLIINTEILSQKLPRSLR